MNKIIKNTTDKNDKQEKLKSHFDKLVNDPEYAYQYYKDIFDTMSIFNSCDDIPEPPVVSEKIYKEVIIPNYIRCGAIPKENLIVGKTYLGNCRNSSEATWNGSMFCYTRTKFGCEYNACANDFEDYTIYEVFVPFKIK